MSSSAVEKIQAKAFYLSDFYDPGETNPYLDIFPEFEAEYNQEAPEIPSNPVNEEPREPLPPESNDQDLLSWTKKRIEDWERKDTLNWLFSVGIKLGLDYGDIVPELALPGQELLFLRKKDFVNYFGSSGKKLHNSLRTRHRANGRKQCNVCEFIRDLLFDPKYCPRLICWDNYGKKRFRVVDSKGVAKLWGERKKNKNMTWEKFSRALRNWRQVIKSVHGRPLVFEFTNKASGLESSFHRDLIGSEK